MDEPDPTPPARPHAGPELEPVLRDLEYPGGALPREALEYAAAHPAEVTPFLLDILRNDASVFAADDEYTGHLFAMYLLAQFREARACPLIVELFSGPGEDVEAMAADFTSDGLDRVLASVSSGDPSAILRLVENAGAYEYARAAGVDALIVMVASGQLTREQAIELFAGLFERVERRPSLLWSVLVGAASDLYPEELLDEIARAYEDDLVDEMFISPEWLENAFQENTAETALAGLAADPRRRLIDDAIAETEWWDSFGGPGRPPWAAPAAPDAPRRKPSRRRPKSQRRAERAARKRNRRR